MVDENHWNQKLMGFSAQQEVENALRGLLSVHNDPTTFRHGTRRIWEYYVDTYYDPNDPETKELYESVTRLFDHTTYENPESPTGNSNWLVKYAPTTVTTSHPRPMDRSEKVELQNVVNDATNRLVDRIHELSGTTEDDVFPDGSTLE